MKSVSEFQTVCVMGLGYIGLPTASLLATKGFTVTGIDVSQKVVDTINKGEIHIVEPDLDILVKSAVHSGNLSASLEPVEADVFIIAVPTPFKDGGPDHISGKKPDLSYIEAATKKISSYVKPGNLVILESTSPVGTTDEVVAAILEQDGHAVGEDVYVAHCPERVLPGRILIELVENDRVVGGINNRSTAVTVDFYERFVRGAVLATSAKTAEMVKLTENSSRDVQIAFANELSMICEYEKIDTWEVIELANRHPRVNILNPGPGVGGLATSRTSERRRAVPIVAHHDAAELLPEAARPGGTCRPAARLVRGGAFAASDASLSPRRWRMSCAKLAHALSEHTGLEPDQGRGRAPRGHGTPRVFRRREERVLRGEARAAGPKVTYLLT